MLARKGAVQLDPDPITWMRSVLREIPVGEAPLTHDIAIRSRTLNLAHEDPADRFIGATAAVCGHTLITADHRLLNCDEFAVLPAK